MMPKFLILLTAVVVVSTCLVAGCAGGTKTYVDQEEAINIGVGGEFVIALDANPTTGYNWQPSYDQSMLELVYDEYDTEKCPGLVGAGGTQYFGFKALKKGETEITLDYLRSWEGESIDQRLFTVNIK